VRLGLERGLDPSQTWWGSGGAANNFSRIWAQRTALAALKTSHLATYKVNFLLFSLN